MLFTSFIVRIQIDLPADRVFICKAKEHLKTHLIHSLFLFHIFLFFAFKNDRETRISLDDGGVGMHADIDASFILSFFFVRSSLNIMPIYTANIVKSQSIQNIK